MSPTHPNRLREFREGNGYTQQELADKVGAGRTTIIRAEQGTQAPTLELADRLADELDTTIDELFSGSERETLSEAYVRGRHDEREETERHRRVEADTASPPAEDLHEWTESIAAFVTGAVHAKPSTGDLANGWYVPNPRGTNRKLDAIVYVTVRRRGPREARRVWEDLLAEHGVESDTEAR
jgi:DNA-binding XRE family transcriptional regulator